MRSDGPVTEPGQFPAPNPVPGRPVDAADRLIVALDFPIASSAFDLVDRLEGLCRWVKIGMELYYAAGNSIVERLRERGLSVFLDLKLHDIPNTVASAVRTVASTGASLLTLHAAGGEKMMRAAAEAAAALPNAPRLLAVTVLTSMDAVGLRATGICELEAGHEGDQMLVENQVLRLARLARGAGIEGLVCSAEEVPTLRREFGPHPGNGPLLVVPGIRPAGSDAADQSRIAGPREAVARGASMLVVGRPITRAADPRTAAGAILREIADAS